MRRRRGAPPARADSGGKARVLLSSRVKTCVLAHYAFRAGARVFCTELPVSGTGANFPDVALIDSEDLVTEVEVKVSLSDLRRDFKKRKHSRGGRDGGRKAADFVPDRFLFAVPDTLDLNRALAAVDELDGTGRCGVMAVTLPREGEAEPLWFSGPGTGAVRIVRPAGDPRPRGSGMPEARRRIEKRLMSELVNQRYMTESYLPALAAGFVPGQDLAETAGAGMSGSAGRKACGADGSCGTGGTGKLCRPGTAGIAGGRDRSGKKGRNGLPGGGPSAGGGACEAPGEVRIASAADAAPKVSGPGSMALERIAGAGAARGSAVPGAAAKMAGKCGKSSGRGTGSNDGASS
ncbi:MAG: hypothetical protein LBQ79_06565 [Deltaproteobacteria bacterium]|nr:hypothetical protein [Deltaproteobacteria bacterium]